jgi:hypothetical protein
MKLKAITFYTLLILVLPMSALASGSFVFDTSQKDISVGDSFSVVVSASSRAQALNAVSGSLQVLGGLSVKGVNKQSSIIDFWTDEPRIIANQIKFEGVVLNPGYQGPSGRLFTITLLARKEGVATISFSDGAILANDGLGSNIIDSLSTLTINIKSSLPNKVDSIPSGPIAIKTVDQSGKIVALPVITEYSESVDSNSRAFIKGKGEPNALTRLTFNDISIKSLGEQFIIALQSKKSKPTEALIKNDDKGLFQYLSSSNLVAGAYNVTPYLVDQDRQTQKPGFGVQLLVNNSKIVKWLVVFINVLALLIPVVCLGVIIYFIPWYSRLRMKILNHKIKLEDEQLNLSEKEIKKKEELIGNP